MSSAIANMMLAAVVLGGISCKDNKPSTGSTTTEAGAAAITATPGKRIRIAVIPKGTTQEYWKIVHAGAVKAAKEADVDIVWKGPLKEDDLKAQIDTLASFVAQGVSGIVVAPLSESALRSPVKSAVDAKIPVVVMDSDLQGDAHTSFVATDNEAAGRLAAEGLAKALDGKGKLVLLRYQEGSASTSNREKGFLEDLKGKNGLTLVSDNQYAGVTTETAFQKSESLLLAHKASDGGVDGVFCPNEMTTFGMLQALKKSSLNRKVKLVGFDASEKLVQALRDGDIEGLVVQNPFNMGYVSVKTMADSLRGKPVDKRIDTGARYVDKTNVDDPAVKEILSPDLKQWLGE